MPRYCFLSHKIEKIMPKYGKESILLDSSSIKSIRRGDSCNVFSSELNSHLGTHIDCHRHFFEKGKTISEYPADFWVFEHPYLLEKELREDEIINKETFFSVSPDTDIILIKSNFQKFRGQTRYSFNNPGISSEAALWLRENRPNLRVLGIDFISISPYQNRQLGAEIHRSFLDPSGRNEPILILEDMDLSTLNSNNGLSFIWVIPLRVEFWDSAPCTIIGKFKN